MSLLFQLLFSPHHLFFPKQKLCKYEVMKQHLQVNRAAEIWQLIKGKKEKIRSLQS